MTWDEDSHYFPKKKMMVGNELREMLLSWQHQSHIFQTLPIYKNHITYLRRFKHLDKYFKPTIFLPRAWRC